MGLLSSYDTAITGYEYLLKSTTIRKEDTVDRLLEIRSALANMTGGRAQTLIDRIDHIMTRLKPIVYESIPDTIDESATDICLATVSFTGLMVALATYIFNASRTSFF